MAWLIERWFGPAFNLDSLRRVLGFFAYLLPPQRRPPPRVPRSRWSCSGPSTAAFFDVWKVWFASAALGVITVAPLLDWDRRGRPRCAIRA